MGSDKSEKKEVRDLFLQLALGLKEEEGNGNETSIEGRGKLEM
jgi:hypothetical protein